MNGKKVNRNAFYAESLRRKKIGFYWGANLLPNIDFYAVNLRRKVNAGQPSFKPWSFHIFFIFRPALYSDRSFLVLLLGAF